MFDSVTSVFQANPWLFYSTVLIIGLCIGSFLNVVAYRLPIIMEREWRSECQQFLDIKPDPDGASFTLSTPASACPHCGHKIRFYENIPLLSYLFLRGRCSSCGVHISLQYPLVEVLTGILSVVVAQRFGVSLHTLAALAFTWILLALTLIDLKKQLLPDSMTLPLLWLGILCALFGLYTDLQSSVVGAMAGYMILWSVYQVFKLVTKKEGMGFGDFKLLAAMAAWVGYAYLPQMILVSAISGSVIGIVMLIFGRAQQQPIPFGPYLAIAGWIALLWGETINESYLSLL
jgi:leader peptidase (prepilin peptidase)/N-methyltransferase